MKVESTSNKCTNLIISILKCQTKLYIKKYWTPHCKNKDCDGTCMDFACRPPIAEEMIMPKIPMTRFDNTDREFGSKGIRINIADRELLSIRVHTNARSLTGQISTKMEFDDKEVPYHQKDEFMEWLAIEMFAVRVRSEKKLEQMKQVEEKVKIVYAPRPKRNWFLNVWFALIGRE